MVDTWHQLGYLVRHLLLVTRLLPHGHDLALTTTLSIDMTIALLLVKRHLLLLVAYFLRLFFVLSLIQDMLKVLCTTLHVSVKFGNLFSLLKVLKELLEVLRILSLLQLLSATNIPQLLIAFLNLECTV